MLKYYITLIILFLSCSLSAQSGNRKADSLKIKALIQESFKNISRNPEQGLNEANEIIKIATSYGWKLNIAEGYRLKASNYHTLANHEKAEDYFIRSLKISKEIADTNGMAKSYGNLGVVSMNMGNHPAALQYYLNALKLNESMKKKIGIARNLGNIGNLYMNMQDYKQAINYAQKSYNSYKELDDPTGMAAQLIALGRINMELKNFEKGKNYYESAKNLFEKLDDTKGLAISYANLGDAYGALKQMDLAFTNIQKALAANKKIGSESGIMNSELTLARLYFDISQNALLLKQHNPFSTKETLLSEAEKMANRCLTTAANTERKLDIEAALILLADIRRAQGHETFAQQTFQDALKIHDSIFSINNANKLVKLESKREIELRDKQIEIQKLQARQQKTIGVVLIAFTLIVIVAGALLYNQNRQRKKTNEQLSAINKELDESNKVKARFFSILSHDLRSPIANLTNYLSILKEAPEMMDETARKTHQNKIEAAANNLLSTMEEILLWSKSQMEHFEPQFKSIQVLQLFEDVKKLIPEDLNAEVVFKNPGKLELTTDENFLKTIMRNLTANALKAIQTTPEGRIEWRAWEEQGKKFLSITDNGQGLSEQQRERLFTENAVVSTKNGLGLHIIRDLAKILNQQIDVVSEQGKGTQFIISWT